MGKFARPLHAEFAPEERGSERHRLRLTGIAHSNGGSGRAMVHDLSETGLRFETAVTLRIGEIVHVELPFVGTIEAHVVRRDGAFYGCEFAVPVSQKTVSTALLRSSPKVDENGDREIEEIPVGTRPSLEEMTQWKVEFERTKGAEGYQLIEFRQTEDGITMAMVTKTN